MAQYKTVGTLLIQFEYQTDAINPDNARTKLQADMEQFDGILTVTNRGTLVLTDPVVDECIKPEEVE